MPAPPKSNTAGTAAAYGRRRPYERRVRQTAYRALRVIGTRFQRAYPDYYEFVPAVRTAEEFADLSARVNCYLGDSGLPMFLEGPRFDIDASLVPHMDPELVRDPGWTSVRPEGTPHLIVHRLTPATLGLYAASRTPATVADGRVFTRAEEMYFEVRDQTTWPTYGPIETGLARLRELSGPNSTAFILATGPSALEVDLGAVDADVRITCNSAVRDLDRIREFSPNIICFTDPVFHFGPSRYAAGFRRDVVRAAEEVDALVVVGQAFAGPLLGLAPALKERLVVLPYQHAGPWRWPTERNPTVRQGGNVMLTLMLPLALYLADHVSIAGADGRQPTENYFWKHNPQLQYSDELMATVFDAHPWFFRDRVYADYYDDFCRNFESLIAVGEAAGKTVVPAAPSWIPALVSRGAPAPVV